MDFYHVRVLHSLHTVAHPAHHNYAIKYRVCFAREESDYQADNFDTVQSVIHSTSLNLIVSVTRPEHGVKYKS
jgi:hypothetical protein